MVKLQRVLLIATALVIAGLALYPPFSTTAAHAGPPIDRGWLFAPLNQRPFPGQEMDASELAYLRANPDAAVQYYEHFGYLPRDMQKAYPYVRVDLSRLTVEWLGTLLVGGLLCFAAWPSSRQRAAPPTPASPSVLAAATGTSIRARGSGPPPLEPLPPTPRSARSPTAPPPQSDAQVGR